MVRAQRGQHASLEELLHYFEAKRRVPRIRAPKRPPDPSKLVCVKRRLPLLFQKQLVQLYYGSAKHFHYPSVRPSELAAIFKLPSTTIRTIIRRFNEQGKNLDTFADRRSHRKKFEKLTATMTRYLLNRTTLQNWAGKPLRERCLLLLHKYNRTVSAANLREFYIKHKISYRKS